MNLTPFRANFSMAGVTTGNVAYLANAIHDVTKPN
jgi:aspartate aminotransferase